MLARYRIRAALSVLLAVCFLPLEGRASGEESTGQWVLTPVTPTQLDAEAWFYNNATGELYFCVHLITKEPKTTAGGVCLPMPRMQLGPVNNVVPALPPSPRRSP